MTAYWGPSKWMKVGDEVTLQLPDDPDSDLNWVVDEARKMGAKDGDTVTFTLADDGKVSRLRVAPP